MSRVLQGGGTSQRAATGPAVLTAPPRHQPGHAYLSASAHLVGVKRLTFAVWNVHFSWLMRLKVVPYSWAACPSSSVKCLLVLSVFLFSCLLFTYWFVSVLYIFWILLLSSSFMVYFKEQTLLIYSGLLVFTFMVSPSYVIKIKQYSPISGSQCTIACFLLKVRLACSRSDSTWNGFPWRGQDPGSCSRALRVSFPCTLPGELWNCLVRVPENPWGIVVRTAFVLLIVLDRIGPFTPMRLIIWEYYKSFHLTRL